MIENGIQNQWEEVKEVLLTLEPEQADSLFAVEYESPNRFFEALKRELRKVISKDKEHILSLENKIEKARNQERYLDEELSILKAKTRLLEDKIKALE